MASDRVWRWNGGGTLVGWNYRPMARSDGRLIPLDLGPPDVRRAWLRGFLARLPALLGDFAYAEEGNVAAWGVGEYACAIDWRTKDGPSALLDFVGKTDGVGYVYAALTLTCLDRNLEPFEITRGAGFYVNFTLTESGALNTAIEDPVYLRIVLYADPYAPISRGPVTDNAVLAAINGPRLTAFLERIERDVPAQLLEVDEEVYRGMVGPRGFLPAPSAGSDA
jgi:hypothetical protein